MPTRPAVLIWVPFFQGLEHRIPAVWTVAGRDRFVVWCCEKYFSYPYSPPATWPYFVQFDKRHQTIRASFSSALPFHITEIKCFSHFHAEEVFT
jgi:hypothetical protein